VNRNLAYTTKSKFSVGPGGQNVRKTFSDKHLAMVCAFRSVYAGNE
jgi:hypothetical protein